MPVSDARALLEYPFDAEIILKKRRSIKKSLLADRDNWLEKRVAVLSGSTTADIVKTLELFLLYHGIKPAFYESEYGQYWNDAMFGAPELAVFKPDIVFIHTSNMNITRFPALSDNAQAADALLEDEAERFRAMWGKLRETHNCPIIQNNFEYPSYRLLGNKDAADFHGRVNFITRLNLKFAEYAQGHADFFINDINYLSAEYGLERWADPFYRHMYKYALCVPAIPNLAFNLANIIKSIFGKNKKAVAVDLDNTLWGGVVGDDGVEGLTIGQETSMGQAFAEFQAYLSELKSIGVVLTVLSKNEPENALAGLNHPDGILRPEDFAAIKADWNPKSENLARMATEMALLPEAFVFVDDNPAEREIVRQNLPDVAVPRTDDVEKFIAAIDKAGFFEVTSFSADDVRRADMYRENAERESMRSSFADYGEYLRSLGMKAAILPFEPLYTERIAQLTNKSNQFNLTTRRYTREQIESAAGDTSRVTLCGRLADKFGDNGIVSVVIARIEGGAAAAHIELWLMSCRVLKRGMEDAMMDALAEACAALGVTALKGYYYPTVKNGMVREFYGDMGFDKNGESPDGASVWTLALDGYEKRNKYIETGSKGAAL